MPATEAGLAHRIRRRHHFGQGRGRASTPPSPTSTAIRSHHTEAIITEDPASVESFFNQIDSAILLHNASTQFADGGEFGFGGEIGIATGKMHARGPVGVEQLTSFKYLIEGSGQVRP